MEAVAITLQSARDGASITSLDAKGEVTLVLAETLPAVTGERARVLKPFGTPPPPLRLSLAERDVPREAQALAIARDIASVLEDPLSLRQVHVLTKLTELCIELDTEAHDTPLTQLAEWLQHPASLARAAKRTTNPALRHFAATLASSESRSTLQALGARLGVLFLSPAMRAALESPTCIDFHAAYAGGADLFDLTAPAGCEEAGRLLGALLFGRAVRAALSRRVTPETRNATLLLDEFPQLLRRPHQRDALSQALALARFRRFSCLLTYQHPSQLDRELLDLVRTCCSIEVFFRMSPGDARTCVPSFPPSTSEDGAQARASLVRRLSTLPRRKAVLWVKLLGLDPVFVRSPRLDLEALRERGAQALRALPPADAQPELLAPSPTVPGHRDHEPAPRAPVNPPPAEGDRDDDVYLDLG